MAGLVVPPTIVLPSGQVVDEATFNAMNAPPPETRGALAEILMGAKRGAMVTVPQMTGQALKAAGATKVGQSLVSGAEGRAPEYAADTAGHNFLTNSLAAGADMLTAAAPLMVASTAAATVGAPAAIATGVGALAGAALFGGSAYQDTYEKAKAAGATDADAHTAGLKQGAIQGIAGAALPPILKGGFAPLAAGAARGFAAPAAQAAKGAVLPALGRAGALTGEMVGVNAAQSAAGRAVDQTVGIDPEAGTPFDAAVNSLSASAGASMILGPFAARHVFAQQRKLTGALDNINRMDADPNARIQAVNDIAPLIASAPPRGADPAAWKATTNQWRLDAMAAAAKGDQIDLSPTFSSEWGGKQIAIQKATAEATGTNVDQLPALPAPPTRLGLPAPPAVQLGELPRGAEMAHQEVPGSQPIPMGVSRTPEEALGAELAQRFPTPKPKAPALSVPDSAESLAATLDAMGAADRTKQAAAKTKAEEADTATLHDQVKQALKDAGLKPEEPKTPQQFAKEYRQSTEGLGASQASIKAAYAEHVRDVMRRNADTLDAHEKAAAEPKPDTTPKAPEPKTAEQVARERAATPVTNNQLGQKLAHELTRQSEERTKQAQLDEIAAAGERSRQLEADATAQPDGRGYNAAHLGTLFDEHTNASDLGLKGQSRGKAKMILDEAAKKPLLVDQIASITEQREKLAKTSIGLRDALDSFSNHLKGLDHGKQETTDAGKGEGQPVRSEEGSRAAPAGNDGGKSTPVREAGSEDTGGKGRSKAEPVRAEVKPEAKPSILDSLEGSGTHTAKVDKAIADTLKELKKLGADGDPIKAATAHQRLTDLLGVKDEANLRDKADAANEKRKARVAAEEKKAADEKLGEVKPGEAKPVQKPPPEKGEHPATTRTQEGRDKLDATVADFTARLRKGEKLTDAERARMDDANDLRKSINHTIQQLEAMGDTPENQPRNRQRQDNLETFLDELMGLAKETETPWASDQREFNGDPHDVNPRVQLALTRNTTIKGLLEDMASMTQTPWVRDLANKLLAQGIDGKLIYAADINPEGKKLNAKGAYNTKTGEVRIKYGAESEHVVMHELVHAATSRALQEAAGITKPKNQREAQLMRAYAELEAIRKQVISDNIIDYREHYGLTNAHEFLAELNTNAEFQALLRSDKSLWQRVLAALDKLLGTNLATKDHLDSALSLQNKFFEENEAAGFGTQSMEHAFESSTGAAARTVDGHLSGLFDAVGRLSEKANLTSKSHKLNAAGLYLSSVHHIVDMASRVQAFKKTFSPLVENYRDLTRKSEQVQQHATTDPSKFAMGLERRLAKLKPGERAAVEGEMGAIGKMASAFNIDPAKNFTENLLANKKLDPKLKPVIDEIHQRYNSFGAAHPDFLKDIKAGEQMGRKGFVNQMATLGRNVLHATVGDVASRERRVQEAQDHLTDAKAKDKGVKTAEAELAEAKQALEHAKTSADTLTKHDLALDILDPKLDADGAARLKKLLAEAKTPEAKAAVQRIRDQHATDGAYEMHQRVEDLFKTAAELPAGHPLKAALEAVNKGYHSQIDNPYLHLGRAGDYFARGSVKDLTPQDKAKVDAVFAKHGLVAADLGRTQDHAFSKFESFEQAEAFQKDMAKALGNKWTDGQHGKLSTDYKLDNKGGVNAALRSLSDGLSETFADVPGLTADQRTQIKESFNQQLLSLLPETSAAKATMLRKGTPGYDAEYVRSFAKRASEIGRNTSSSYTMRDYTETFRKMNEEVERLAGSDPDNQVKARQITDELGKRHANSMKPQGSSVVSAINGFGFSYYLGASPAFVIRNALQPWHLTLPQLGGKFGFVKSAKALGVGSRDAFKILQATIKQGLAGHDWRGVLDVGMNFDNLGLSEGKKQFLKEMIDKGVIQSGQTNQINELLGPVGNHSLRDAVRVAGMFADYSEKFNRLAAGLAAYDLSGGNRRYAMDVVESSMINYEAHNTARALGPHAAVTGQATPLLSQFAKYNFGVLEMVHNLMHDALGQQHDGTPAGKAAAKAAQKEAVKTMAGLAATTTMLAGVMGLPFVSAFAGLYNMLTKDKDDPQDVRIQVQAWLAKTFGKGVGEMLSHGLPRGAGVDMSSIGLQDILPGSGMLADRAPLKDMLANQSQSMLGPAINGGMNVAEGLQKMSDGYYLKGLETLLPTALKNLAKSYDVAEHGYTDSKGNPIPARATPLGVITQALGFRASAKAISDEVNQAAYADREIKAQRRNVIADHLYKAYTSKDAGDIAEWESKRAAFNAKNPADPIRKIDAFRSNAKGMAGADQAGIAVKMPPKQAFTKGERYAIGDVGN